MTCSSETSQRRPCSAASRATARIIGVGPQTYSLIDASSRAGLPSASPSGAVTRPVVPRAAVLGGEHDVDAEPLEQLDVVQLRGACARRRTASPACRSCCEARRPASRTAPARRRPRPSTPPPAARPARTAGRAVRDTATRRARLDVVEQRGADADALVQDRDADRRAVGVAQHFEDRERPPQQRIACRATA